MTDLITEPGVSNKQSMEDEMSKDTEIADIDKPTPENTALTVAPQEPTIMGMLADAVKDPDFNADKLEQLIGLKERVDATEARKAFIDAMYEFHLDPPKIVKSKPVYGKDKGAGPQYHFAEFDETVRIVRPALLKVGIVATWASESLEGDVTRVTCILRHKMGHEETASMAGAPEAGGSKNAIQGIGSSSSYLRRYTYLLATGLVAEGDDTDGVSDDEIITEEQARGLETRIEGLGGDKVKNIQVLCNFLGVDSLADIPAFKLSQANLALKDREKSK